MYLRDDRLAMEMRNHKGTKAQRRARWRENYFSVCRVFIAVAILFCGIGCARPAGVIFPQTGKARVWPNPPEPPRIRYVGTLASSADLHAEKTSIEVVGDVLRGPLPNVPFTGPQSIAPGPGSLVAIADGAGAAVHILDLDKRSHTLVAGWGTERFKVPFGVTWVGDRLFATDAQRHEVVELGVDGQFRRAFGTEELVRPVGIAFEPSRQALYVVDGGSHSIRVFDLNGRLLRSFGSRGAGTNEFNFPSHIAVKDQSLAVTDSGNFRVLLLDLDGNHRLTIGKKGDAAGDFALPKGVAFDCDGHIYVVDSQFENVQIFDRDGRLLLAFGEEGNRAGQFSLPAGIGVGADNRVWVADSGNHRLQVFDYLRATP